MDSLSQYVVYGAVNPLVLVCLTQRVFFIAYVTSKIATFVLKNFYVKYLRLNFVLSAYADHVSLPSDKTGVSINL